ncbi:hypothetical protein O0L34_g15115 [Tuta absoluta]|nr:hypothetical protein O0L34_g15115 [Tuta absoluta]
MPDKIYEPYDYTPVATGFGQLKTTEPVKIWRLYLAAVVANMSVLAAGYVMAWTSPVISKLRDPAQSPLPETITKDQEAWVGSLLTVGAIAGPFVGSLAATKLGRRWGLLISALPLLLGLVLVAMANNVVYLYVGRMIWGVACGMIYTISPMYCAEIATVDVRGALGSLLSTFVCTGFLVMYVIGPFVSYYMISYIGIGIVVLFIGTFFFMPETPKYLLMKNRREDAAASLMALRGMSREGVEPELNELMEEIKDSSANTKTIIDECKMLASGGNFKGFYISCVLVLAQQFSGINAVLFYMSTIFTAAGSKLEPDIATIIIGVVLVICCFITSVAVEKLGRKLLLLISCAGAAIGMGLLGMYFFLDSQKSPMAVNLNFLPLLSLIIFIVTYSFGLGPMPWIYLSELLPMEVKSVASPVATAFCWCMAFLVTRYFSLLGVMIGDHGVYWICGIFCALSFVFTMFVVPETKGKTALEIKELLAKRR